ncbi:MAG: response regulator [Candidatus Omnitrophica bacterium]|nr:response regulator [Candidatus Omnitrophota bacterium]
MSNNVLVVDDEKIVCRAAQKILEIEGYKVVIALSGEEAVALAKKDKFQMALVDLILPGIDGVEVCRQLKLENPDIKVVLMSGYLSKLKERQDVFDSLGGCTEVMEKPFGGEDITRIAADFFERGHGC